MVNTGNANAGTGETGLANAQATCAEVAKLLGCEAGQVLPFLAGIISGLAWAIKAAARSERDQLIKEKQPFEILTH